MPGAQTPEKGGPTRSGTMVTNSRGNSDMAASERSVRGRAQSGQRYRECWTPTRLVGAVVVILLLAACTSGGGSNDNPTTTATATAPDTSPCTGPNGVGGPVPSGLGPGDLVAAVDLTPANASSPGFPTRASG